MSPWWYIQRGRVEKKTQLLDTQLCSTHTFWLKPWSLFLNHIWSFSFSSSHSEFVFPKIKPRWSHKISQIFLCTCANDWKVINYLTFMCLCIMYVITAIGFFIESRFSGTVTCCSLMLIKRVNTCCSWERCAEVLSRWIKQLFIIKKYLQPRACFLNHHVSFLFPQVLNTLLKHFLDAPCLFLH